jgi:PIN domain nuclease of toxin-antitoxin system
MNALLDTCALIWLVNGDSALGADARKAIRTAWMVSVSSVTAWELGLKLAKGKLEIEEPLDSWWRGAIAQHNLTDLPLDSQSAIRATHLPPLHGDPADRLLIATALEHDLTVLTPDPLIRKYPGLRTIW